ncbi:MAG: fibro-slime domain-containing protein [Oscillospiraceae bacterium]|nr:fibro-slime domain-containing protein [Oscillospiraceae bacterium]
MKKHSIGSRLLSLLLALAMILPMIPMLRSEVSAATGDVTKFLTASQDGITMLNNGNHITLPIKVNNFVLDGMLFDYLSSTRSANNADSYYWEYSKDNGRAYIQLYPYYLSDKSIGDSSLNIVSTTGLSGPVAINGTLDANTSTTLDTYGNRSDGAPQAWRPLTPTKVTDGGGTAFLRLTPDGQRDNTNGNNPNGTGKHRAWTKLTTFETTHTPVVDDIRYAVLIYRLPNGTSVNDYDTGAKYPNMGLTINYFDEAAGSCSRYVTVNTAANSNWQYAIIDLMGLGTSDNRRILSGTKVNSVYLQTPLSYQDATNYMDVAGVAYFPYYGDAEQFAYFGVTMGCQQKYFNANNAGFSLRNHTNTHYALTGSTRTKVLVKSLPTFWTDNEYLGSRTFNVDTYGNHKLNNTTLQNLQTLTDLFNPMSDGSTKTILDTTGTNLFGTIQGQATLGLVEAELGEDGRPVYKKSVVHYLAAYLRHQLLTLPEYPSDNYGWRNYSFITGVSTSGGTNEALFGTNSQGQSIDLATALCQQIGVKKGGAVKSGTSGSFGYASHYDYKLAGPDDGYYGNYADTIAHKDDLIGTWSECKGNIHTWFDAAYYLLHNLYVTDTDVADVKVDGYGEYEDDYQALIVPQVQFTSGGKTSTPYFFDSGYSYYTNIDDNSTYTSALVFDKTQHTITLSGDAQGAAQFNITDGQLATSWFPFLLTSGNGTGQGETNSPYYLHDGVISRETQGTTYRSRDFHYSLTGSGYFAYEPGLYFNFRGDDDVFVFINGQLVVDLGGTHGAAAYNMSLDDYVTWANNVKSGKEQYKGSNYAGLSAADKARVDALCLVTGGVYSFDFFYMERHGVGSNLRIMTNMQIVESNLKVDKFAYQNGVEVTDNGIGDMDAVLEYGFSITNNSDGKLYDLSFTDTTIGVSINCDRGLEVTGNVTNAYGSKLTPSGLVITVDGYNQSGDKLDTIYVTCPDNESLKAFLKTLSSSGTEGGNVEQDYDKPYSGSGLWKNATVTIRGIYYQLTETQKKVSSFTNSVVGTGFAKVAGENGLLENYVLRGIDKHTFYQPGKPVYYQWVNHPIVIESERLYSDLLAGNIVESANDLPSPENMILIPSNSGGTEIAMDGLSNVPGGDVYLKINYTTPGSYMAYVTVRDAADDTFSMTVPITIYAVGGHDSVIVLDYGLDTYLTENDAILKDELDAATGNVTGSILGIAKDTITPTYQKYDEQSVIEAPGQLANNLSILTGTYDSATGDHDGVVYELDKPVYLDHNKPWVIEWKALHEGVGTLLFSEMSTSTNGNYYIFLSPGAGRFFIGHHDSEHIDINNNPNVLMYNNYVV